MTEKIIASNEALALIALLREKYGPIVFIQSAGCCDGTAPMCFLEGDFYLGSRDKLIGHIGDVPYYMHESMMPMWEGMQLVLGVSEGRGASFSLETREDKGFTLVAKKIKN